MQCIYKVFTSLSGLREHLKMYTSETSYHGRSFGMFLNQGLFLATLNTLH